MQRNCPQCGSEAVGGRFCRQCGAPLVAETEASSAATRSYPANRSPSAQTAPPREPDTPSGYPSPDTARLYRPPATPSYTVPKPSRSGAMLWIVLALLCALAIGGVISAALIPSYLARRQAPVAPPEIATSVPEIKVDPPQIPPLPPVPPAPPVTDKELPQTIAELKYPHSTTEKLLTVPGGEILILRTPDDRNEVKKFYQVLLDNPIVTEGRNEVSLTVPGPNTITVKIKSDPSPAGQLVITIIRTGAPFRNPR
jgi:hypothetical protein